MAKTDTKDTKTDTSESGLIQGEGESLGLERPPSGAYIRYGMSAGLVSSLVAMVFWMAMTYLRGNGFYTPLKTVAAGWLGSGALGGGFASGLLGALTLMVLALIWGGFYGWSVGQGARPLGARVLVGLLVSAVAWVIITYLVIPSANPYLDSLISLSPGAWFGTFLVFGVSLSFAPIFLRDQNVDTFTEPDTRMV